VCSGNAREPEEVSLNPSTSQRPPASPPVRPTKGKRGSKPLGKKTRKVIDTCIPIRGFTVEVSVLQAAGPPAIFPIAFKQPVDVMKYIVTEPLGQSAICQQCKKDFKEKDQTLVRHWLEVHAFKDLQAVFKDPAADHSESIINSQRKRDIFLAALYICPIDGCHTWDRLRVRVFATKHTLDPHAATHYKRQEEKLGKGTPLVAQMRNRFATHVSEHPFWQETAQDYARFTCRDNKLVWMLNQ